MSDLDRRVHAEHAQGYLIVRYSRAGKWYLEREEDGVGGPTSRRRLLTVAEAAQIATEPGWVWHEGRVGGTAFDAKVRDCWEANDE